MSAYCDEIAICSHYPKCLDRGCPYDGAETAYEGEEE